MGLDSEVKLRLYHLNGYKKRGTKAPFDTFVSSVLLVSTNKTQKLSVTATVEPSRFRAYCGIITATALRRCPISDYKCMERACPYPATMLGYCGMHYDLRYADKTNLSLVSMSRRSGQGGSTDYSWKFSKRRHKDAPENES